MCCLPRIPVDQCTYNIPISRMHVLARNTWGPAHCPQGYSPRVLNLTCGPNAEMATNVTCTLVPCPHPSQYAARTIAGHASAMPVGAAHSQQVFIVGDRATLFCPKSTPQLYLGVTVRPAIFSALIVCSHHLIQGKVRSIWLPVNSSPYQFDDGIPGTPSSNYTAPRYPVCDGKLFATPHRNHPFLLCTSR